MFADQTDLLEPYLSSRFNLVVSRVAVHSETPLKTKREACLSKTSGETNPNRIPGAELRHVTGSFLAYRFVTPVRIMLTGTRSGRIFHVRFGTGPVAGLFGTGPLPDQPVIPVGSTG